MDRLNDADRWDAVRIAFDALGADDKLEVMAFAENIANGVALRRHGEKSGLGPSTLLEIVAALGRMLEENDG